MSLQMAQLSEWKVSGSTANQRSYRPVVLDVYKKSPHDALYLSKHHQSP